MRTVNRTRMTRIGLVGTPACRRGRDFKSALIRFICVIRVPLLHACCVPSLLLITFLSIVASNVYAQEKTVTVGIQVKPIFPVKFLKTDAQTISQNGVDFSIAQKLGYSGGMVIRWGFTKTLSLETGINYVKRNYELDFNTDTFRGKTTFGIVNYQIPINALVFIRLGKKLYMNASAGLSVDMYVSDIHTFDPAYFNHYGYRNGVFQSGVLSNLGFEYRTEKAGYFYIGASFQRPFTNIYNASLRYFKPDATIETTVIKIQGSYLTFDVRYFFNPLPIVKGVKKKKKVQSTE